MKYTPKFDHIPINLGIRIPNFVRFWGFVFPIKPGLYYIMKTAGFSTFKRNKKSFLAKLPEKCAETGKTQLFLFLKAIRRKLNETNAVHKVLKPFFLIFPLILVS